MDLMRSLQNSPKPDEMTNAKASIRKKMMVSMNTKTGFRALKMYLALCACTALQVRTRNKNYFSSQTGVPVV